MAPIKSALCLLLIVAFTQHGVCGRKLSRVPALLQDQASPDASCENGINTCKTRLMEAVVKSSKGAPDIRRICRAMNEFVTCVLDLSCPMRIDQLRSLIRRTLGSISDFCELDPSVTARLNSLREQESQRPALDPVDSAQNLEDSPSAETTMLATQPPVTQTTLSSETMTQKDWSMEFDVCTEEFFKAMQQPGMMSTDICPHFQRMVSCVDSFHGRIPEADRESALDQARSFMSQFDLQCESSNAVPPSPLPINPTRGTSADPGGAGGSESCARDIATCADQLMIVVTGNSQSVPSVAKICRAFNTFMTCVLDTPCSLPAEQLLNVIDQSLGQMEGFCELDESVAARIETLRQSVSGGQSPSTTTGTHVTPTPQGSTSSISPSPIPRGTSPGTGVAGDLESCANDMKVCTDQLMNVVIRNSQSVPNVTAICKAFNNFVTCVLDSPCSVPAEQLLGVIDQSLDQMGGICAFDESVLARLETLRQSVSSGQSPSATTGTDVTPIPQDCSQGINACTETFLTTMSQAGRELPDVCREFDIMASCILAVPCPLSEMDKERALETSRNMLSLFGGDCESTSTRSPSPSPLTSSETSVQSAADCRETISTCTDRLTSEISQSVQGGQDLVRICRAWNEFLTCLLDAPCPWRSGQLLRMIDEAIGTMGNACQLDEPVLARVDALRQKESGGQSPNAGEIDTKQDCAQRFEICRTTFADAMSRPGVGETDICPNFITMMKCVRAIPCALTESYMEQAMTFGSQMIGPAVFSCDLQSVLAPETTTLSTMMANGDCVQRFETCKMTFSDAMMQPGVGETDICPNFITLMKCVRAIPCALTEGYMEQAMTFGTQMIGPAVLQCDLQSAFAETTTSAPDRTTLSTIMAKRDCAQRFQTCKMTFSDAMSQPGVGETDICSNFIILMKCARALPCALTEGYMEQAMTFGTQMIGPAVLQCDLQSAFAKTTTSAPEITTLSTTMQNRGVYCEEIKAECIKNSTIKYHTTSGILDTVSMCKQINAYLTCLFAQPCELTPEQKRKEIEEMQSALDALGATQCVLNVPATGGDSGMKVETTTTESPIPTTTASKGPEVTNVQAVAKGTKILVTWDYSSTGSEILLGFKISYEWRSKSTKPGSGTLRVKPIAEEDGTWQALLKNLQIRTKYYIKVAPIYTEYMGEPSEEISLWLSGQDLSTEPELSIMAIPLSLNTVLISYKITEPSRVSNLRLLYMKDGDKKWTPVDKNNIQGSSAIVKGLMSETVYYFVAKGRVGKKYKTAVTHFQTPGQAAADESDLTIIASLAGDNTISAQWSHSKGTAGVKGYKLTLQMNDGSFHGPIQTLYDFRSEGTTTFTYIDQSAAYSVKIEPFDDHGVSSPRGIFSDTIIPSKMIP